MRGLGSGAVAHLKNSTGATITKGSVVKLSTVADDSIILTAIGGAGAVGVAQTDIPAGNYGTIVVAGMAEVYSTAVCARGNILSGSATVAGQVDPTAAYSGAQVIGKAARAAGGAGLVWCEVGLTLYTVPTVVPAAMTPYDQILTYAGNGLNIPVGITPWEAVTKTTGNVLPVDRLALFPFSAPFDMTIPKIRTYGTWNDGAYIVGVGIYACPGNGDMRPGALLAQNNTTLMVAGWRDATFNYAIARGTRVMIGIVCHQGYGTFMNLVYLAQSTSSRVGAFGLPDTFFSSTTPRGPTGYYCTHAYDPGVGMPNPCPATELFYGPQGPLGSSGEIPAIVVGGF